MAGDTELLVQSRRTNTLLLLAFGKQIASRIEDVLARAPAKAVLMALADAPAKELPSADLLAAARARGVARTTFFTTLSELQRAGLVDRPRRGYAALPPDVEAFLPTDRQPRSEPTISSREELEQSQ